MSRVLMRCPPKLMLICFGASRMVTSISRFLRRYALTSSLLATSSWPFWI
jgi:hypothetical protein